MKILMLGDSPFIKTGFGIVNSVAVEHLKSVGHQLVVIGAQDTQKRDLGKGRVDGKRCNRLEERLDHAEEA
jgi:hypothetical protein